MNTPFYCPLLFETLDTFCATNQWWSLGGEGAVAPPPIISDLEKYGKDSLVVVYALAFMRVCPLPPLPQENAKMPATATNSLTSTRTWLYLLFLPRCRLF